MDITELWTVLDKKLDTFKDDLSKNIDTSINGHYLQCQNARLEAEKDQKSIEVNKPIWYALMKGMTAKDIIWIIVVIILYASSGKDLTPKQKEVLDRMEKVTKVTSVDGTDFN
jgi:hypothetical protein